MHKNPAIILFLLLVLTSCNIPPLRSSDSANQVSTRVALTLQASLAQETTTLEIIKETPILINTSARPTTDSTVTPSPTPSDPSLTLGSPVYSDSFTSGSAFGLEKPYSDNAVEMKVENGNLVMTSLQARNWTSFRLSYLTPKDYYIEGKFKTITCTGSDYYGLVMRAPNYTDVLGYYFGISCDGKYKFSRWEYTSQEVLADWTSDALIASGPGKENRIGVMLKENHFSLYINSKLVKELNDDGNNAKGYYGVFISAVNNPTMQVNVEEINQWNLP